MTDPTKPTVVKPSRGLRPSWWWWLILLVAFIALQWPMVKGTLYRFTGGPASTIQWRTDYQAALAESGKTGKPVLIDFTASWCPPCRVMKHEVWPDGEVSRLANEKFIPLLMDVDAPGSAEASQRYAIRTIPSILIVDAQGQTLSAGSFMSRDDMVAFLTRK